MSWSNKEWERLYGLIFGSYNRLEGCDPKDLREGIQGDLAEACQMVEAEMERRNRIIEAAKGALDG